MLPKIQPALSDYYSDNAEPLSTRIFESIWNGLSNTNHSTENDIKYKPKILDLGRAQPDSFNFYSEHNCYLTIADCIQPFINLSWPAGENPNGVLMEKIAKTISAPEKKYDLILAWDSLNYINPKVLPFVHNHLLNFCTNKTIIHGFVFTSETYPTESGDFKIIDSDKIQHSVANNEVIRHSPLTPHAINKAMPSFKYARSVLMRSGLQEFMLIRK